MDPQPSEEGIQGPKPALQKQRCTAALSPFPGPLLCSSSHPALSQDGQVQSTPAPRKGPCGLKARSAASEPQVPVCPFTAGKMGSLAVLAACSFHLVSAQLQRASALPPGLPYRSGPCLPGNTCPWPGGGNETQQKETAFSGNGFFGVGRFLKL